MAQNNLQKGEWALIKQNEPRSFYYSYFWISLSFSVKNLTIVTYISITLRASLKIQSLMELFHHEQDMLAYHAT